MMMKTSHRDQNTRERRTTESVRQLIGGSGISLLRVAAVEDQYAARGSKDAKL